MFRPTFPVLRPGGPVAALAAALLLGAAPSAPAQEAGPALTGVVLSPEGEPVSDVRVRIVELGLGALTDVEGRFRIAPVPPGGYLVEARADDWGDAVERVNVTAGAGSTVELRLGWLYQVPDLLVSAAPSAVRRTEAVQATDVLDGRELETSAAASLGETLRGRPGVTATYFGPGASRPLIRGLGGDRVQILLGGVGVADASNTSPDHAVGADPFAAERIEVVRGPATLLYGSSAIGGVVNVLDGRIPREPEGRALTGRLLSRGGTVADELTGAASLSGDLGGALTWQASGLRRATDDALLPDGDPLANSDLETTQGDAGVSFVSDRGFAGIAWSGYGAEYGVPGGEAAHGHAGQEEGHAGEEGDHADEPGHGEGVRIDLDRWRLDAETDWTLDEGALRGIRGRFAYTDYRHTELEGAETGTRFDNEEWEARVEARHRLPGDLSGAAGLQLRRRDFTAVGEEAFVPPTDTDGWAAFLFEAWESGRVRLEGGVRFERQTAREEAAGTERTRDGLSASAGASWRAGGPVVLSVSGARSRKLPTAEELFSDGPHLATRAYEIGHPDLLPETGYSLDLGLRLDEGPLRGEVTVFANRFEDHIYLAFAGEEREGLEVLRYVQEDASHVGFEARAEAEVARPGDGRLLVEGQADYVRAEILARDEPLPRIPPLRYGGGLRWTSRAWSARSSWLRTTAQDRVAPAEETTGGYHTVDASLGYRFATGLLGHGITLSGSNLTNELARSHVSFLKDVAPLPGREVRLTYRLSF